MYPILVSGDSILGTKVSGFDFLAIHFESESFCFDYLGIYIWNGFFHLGFWKSMRSMVMLQRRVRRNGV